jgi:hypothetical protein
MTPDIFFVSSREPHAERNWARLLSIAPRARRISDQPNIHAAYVACAAASRTPHCFMVDGDNWLLDGFAFELDFEPNPRGVAVWRARNPVNGLIYGHGGIKLLPAAFILTTTGAGEIDIGSGIAAEYRSVHVLASEHRFNTSPFHTWRTAFREAVKLSAGLIPHADPAVLKARLATWCADAAVHPAPAYEDLCAAGAREGRSYGHRYVKQTIALDRINDFAWLRELWDARGPGK